MFYFIVIILLAICCKKIEIHQSALKGSQNRRTVGHLLSQETVPHWSCLAQWLRHSVPDISQRHMLILQHHSKATGEQDTDKRVRTALKQPTDICFLAFNPHSPEVHLLESVVQAVKALPQLTLISLLTAHAVTWSRCFSARSGRVVNSSSTTNSVTGRKKTSHYIYW